MPVDVNTPPPEAYDILISDISEEDITQLGEELQTFNLSDAVTEGTFPIAGTFYGENLRLFVPLTVKKRKACKWVLFLLDTGSPYTFLRTDTYRELGFQEFVPSTTQVSINGVSISVSPSHGNFENINLLGQNFLKAANVNLAINYKAGTVALQLAAELSE